jgi:pantoate kinase
VGITLQNGVEATVRPAEQNAILVNGEAWDFPTVNSVVQALTTQSVEVVINATLPFGAGFGMSGASALATALALDVSLGLNRSRADLAMVAHIAEVTCGTGLGDVCGQVVGGFRIRRELGHPLASEPLDISEERLYFRVFGPLETKGIIGDDEKIQRINKAGDQALEAVRRTATLGLPELIEISCRFASQSGLLTSEKVTDTIHEIERDGGNASMVMLGESVYADIPFPGCQTGIIGRTGAMVL